MFVKLLLPFVLLIRLGQLPNSIWEKNYEIVFERIDGWQANPEYVGPTSFVRIRRPNRSTTPALHVLTDIIKPMPRDTEVEVTLYEAHENRLVPSWLNYKRNFCDYVEKEKRPLFDSLAKEFKFEKCPIVGLYKLENYRPDKLLPPVLTGPDRMMYEVKLKSVNTNIYKFGVIFQVDRSKNTRGREKAKA